MRVLVAPDAGLASDFVQAVATRLAGELQAGSTGRELTVVMVAWINVPVD